MHLSLKLQKHLHGLLVVCRLSQNLSLNGNHRVCTNHQRILTVYGRFFRLYFYTALAPLPLSSFAGEGTSFAGTAFLKSYVGVCLEGAIIVLACLIFSAFMSSGTPVVDTSLSAVTMSWQYIGETIFNMMVLVGLVKGAERIVKEMFGL